MSYRPQTFYVLKDEQGQLLTNDNGSPQIFHNRYSAEQAAAGQPVTVKPLTY